MDFFQSWTMWRHWRRRRYQRLSSRAGRLKTRRSSRPVTSMESGWCLRENGLSDISRKGRTREYRPSRGSRKDCLFSIKRILLVSNLGGIERTLISDIRYRYTDIEVQQKEAKTYE